MSKSPSCFEKYVADSLEQGSLIPTAQKEKEIYTLGYHLYNDQNYEQAAHFFRFLATWSPTEKKYLKSLGAALQMQNRYEEALRCYVGAQLLQTQQSDPYLYVYAADCYFAMGQVKQGLKALEGAKKAASEQQEEKVAHHVAFMRQQWSEKK